jgi:hypothetical protein
MVIKRSSSLNGTLIKSFGITQVQAIIIVDPLSIVIRIDPNLDLGDIATITTAAKACLYDNTF